MFPISGVHLHNRHKIRKTLLPASAKNLDLGKQDSCVNAPNGGPPGSLAALLAVLVAHVFAAFFRGSAYRGASSFGLVQGFREGP